MVDLKFAISLKELQLPDNSIISTIPSVMVHTSRNMLVKRFLESNCDKLLFLDVDEVFENDLALRLYADDKDIVGAMICSRVPEYKPCITKKVGNKLTSVFPYERKIFEVDTIGMGATMIKRKVFEKMKPPYFYFSNMREGIDTPENNVGEDINFCLDAGKAGFKIYCDASLNPLHIGNKEETDYRRAVMYNLSVLGEKGVNKIIEGYYNGK